MIEYKPMTLADRLRFFDANDNWPTLREAADVIERLTAQNKKLRELLARGITIANLDEVSFNTDFVKEAQEALDSTWSPE